MVGDADGVDAQPVGVLVIHGFTGSPASVAPVADGLRAAGFDVDVPLLPGHGTSPVDLATREYAEWLGCVEERFAALARRCRAVGVFGISMGGGLALRLAAAHEDVAGVIVVNPLAEPVDPVFIGLLEQGLAGGSTTIPSIGSDIALEDHPPTGGYDETPIAPLLSLVRGVGESAPLLSSVTAPVLLITSRVDHVVPTSTGEYLERTLGGAIERVMLERSFHVATLDYDREDIVRRSVEFMERLAL